MPSFGSFIQSAAAPVTTGLNLFSGGQQPPRPPDAPPPERQIVAEALAQPSVYSPFGSAVYSGSPTDGTFRQTITLSPQEQALYEGRSGVARAMLSRGSEALNDLPVNFTPRGATTPGRFEFRGAEDPTTNRFFMAQKKLLDDSFAEDEERLEQRLANQGLPMGSEAYREDFDDLRTNRADALERASTNALDRGFSQALATHQQDVGDTGEQFRRDLTGRQQAYNEIAAALSGAQLQPVSGGGSPIDTSGAFANEQAGINRAYQGDLAAYNARIGQQNALLGGGATVAAAFV